jgi:spermidine synthase
LEHNQQQLHKGFALYLLLTCLLCGALIMVIEVMGSRVIGPFFGVSLFVWTSLITVTLVALAIGYAVGGVISDNYAEPKYLYGIILVAALFVLLVPVIKDPVLKACVPLGLRTGSFLSTLVLFGPSLFLLGCVSPYLVKIAARQLKNLGRLVGGLYALSTIGSTVGTVLTGFVLIAYLGVDNIFTVIGVLLVALSVGYFIVFERRYWTAALLILPAFFLFQPEFKEKTLQDGTKVTKVYEEDTYYGNLKVVDYSYGDRHIRELLIDGMIQGGVDMNNRLSLYDYSYYLQFLPYAMHPEAKRCLVFGLGTGVVPKWYGKHNVPCDVVDIDPEVFHIAKNYFDYRPAGEDAAYDARYYLEINRKKYGHVILDVFNGDITPGYLLSVEALQLIRHSLTPRGILSINLIASLKEKPFMSASVVKTLQQVFDQVELYPVFDPEKGNGIGNVIVLAYQGPPRSINKQVLANFRVHPRLRERIVNNIGRRFRFSPDTPAMILTDNYNPIDFYDSWLRELNRRWIIDAIDWDVLIG